MLDSVAPTRVDHAGSGAAARAVAYVAVRLAGQTRYGAGRHEDVVLATFRAVVSAYERLQVPVVSAASATGRA